VELIAADKARIILGNSNLKNKASVLLFYRARYRKMIQNLIWATFYVVENLLAPGGLYKWDML
jgi:Cu2+-exporting ATPase